MRQSGLRPSTAPPAPQLEGLGLLATAVVELAPDGRVVAANPSAEALFRVPLIGRSLADILDEGEKLGLLERGPAARLQSGAVLHTADGRQFACTVCSDREGSLYELADITQQLARIRSGQRDLLTGLANRAEFRDRLALELAQAEVARPVAVIAIDLDRFKTVNDTLGQAVGDSLLKVVADRIGRILPEGALLARLGGDEFAILLPGHDAEKAGPLAARIVDIVGRAFLLDGNMVHIGASLGIAAAPADADVVETLISRADLALFAAKSDGRGTYRVFQLEMDAALQERRRLEMALRRALVLQEFTLAYQPQVDIASGRVIGFEALLRWSHEGKPVLPASFVPLAEELGLISPLGEWVLRTACREAAAWPDGIGISVNLSPLQFRGSSQLLATVTSALAAAGLPPHRLELEITEGALLAETEAVVSTLRTLQGLGVKVAMDDFGTGYSSLSYLQKFPFDKIKIDQSFVRAMLADKDSAAIVRAVAALGRSLGMTTIAEGVETDEQLAQVRNNGCDVVQGYLTGRPLAPEAALALARSQPPSHS